MTNEQQIEDFLNPKVTKKRLISSSIYVLAFESMKDSIVSKLKFYYCLGDEKNTDKYKQKVLDRNGSPIFATLDWFRERGAIDDSDIDIFRQIKACRNTLCHDHYKLIGSEGLPNDFDVCFERLIKLIHKVDLWWVINVEIATDPDYMEQEIDESEIKVGSVLMLQMLMDIALGDDNEAEAYLELYKNSFKS